MRHGNWSCEAGGGRGSQVEVNCERKNPACAEAVPQESPEGGSEIHARQSFALLVSRMSTSPLLLVPEPMKRRKGIKTHTNNPINFIPEPRNTSSINQRTAVCNVEITSIYRIFPPGSEPSVISSKKATMVAIFWSRGAQPVK